VNREATDGRAVSAIARSLEDLLVADAQARPAEHSPTSAPALIGSPAGLNDPGTGGCAILAEKPGLTGPSNVRTLATSARASRDQIERQADPHPEARSCTADGPRVFSDAYWNEIDQLYSISEGESV
jgi:hypothetical protein